MATKNRTNKQTHISADGAVLIRAYLYLFEEEWEILHTRARVQSVSTSKFIANLLAELAAIRNKGITNDTATISSTRNH